MLRRKEERRKGGASASLDKLGWLPRCGAILARMWYTSILSSAFNPVLRGPLISSAETTINVDRGPQSSRQSTCRSLLWMVLAGLAIRLIVVGFLYPERTDPARDHWRFGGEAGRIARSIALGEGFSNPLF